MFTSCKLMNLLRSSIQILNSGLISGAKLHSRKIPSYYSLGKQSARQEFLFFRRGVSQLTNENESSYSGGKYVQMRGLPFEATTEDIVNFFRPLQIEPVEVTIQRNQMGRSSGFASVKFKSSDDALKALANHRNYMGRRYIELSLNMRPTDFPLREVSQATASDFSTKGHRVILKGVPYDATTDDIVQFFAPLNIKPSKVEIKFGRFNLPSGICECVFDSDEDAITALKNHRSYIGRRWIEVVLASGSAYERS